MIEIRLDDTLEREQNMLLKRCYEARLDREKTEAYKQGYNDAIRNLEDLIRNFRQGVIS